MGAGLPGFWRTLNPTLARFRSGEVRRYLGDPESPQGFISGGANGTGRETEPVNGTEPGVYTDILGSGSPVDRRTPCGSNGTADGFLKSVMFIFENKYFYL